MCSGKVVRKFIHRVFSMCPGNVDRKCNHRESFICVQEMLTEN